MVYCNFKPDYLVVLNVSIKSNNWCSYQLWLYLFKKNLRKTEELIKKKNHCLYTCHFLYSLCELMCQGTIRLLVNPSSYFFPLRWLQGPQSGSRFNEWSCGYVNFYFKYFEM